MGPPPKPPLRPIVYAGNFLWTPALGQLKIIEDGAIGVDENGVIIFILDDVKTELRVVTKSPGLGVSRVKLREEVARHGLKDGEWDLVEGGSDGLDWWFPGFVGT